MVEIIMYYCTLYKNILKENAENTEHVCQCTHGDINHNIKEYEVYQICRVIGCDCIEFKELNEIDVE